MKKIIFTIISIPVLIILILAVNFIIFQNSVEEISTGRPITKNDTIKQALLVIDIQEGTTGAYSENEYYKKRAEETISVVNLLADSSRKANIPVVYIQTVLRDFLINILNDTYAPDSEGSKLDLRLKLVSGNIFEKDKADAFCNPELDKFLIDNKINKLVFTGLDLDGCVKNTIEAAKNRNYDICLVSDAVLAKSDSLMTVKLDYFGERGYEVVTGKEYLQSIR